MARQIARVGDTFWVPLEDGTHSLGQIVEIQPAVLNSITCAFFDCRQPQPTPVSLSSRPLITVQFVTGHLFRSGAWMRVENCPVTVEPHELPYRDTESRGWVGAKVVGSGLILEFLSAYYGLRSWREMHDPDYFQKLLRPGIAPYARA